MEIKQKISVFTTIFSLCMIANEVWAEQNQNEQDHQAKVETNANTTMYLGLAVGTIIVGLIAFLTFKVKPEGDKVTDDVLADILDE